MQFHELCIDFFILFCVCLCVVSNIGEECLSAKIINKASLLHRANWLLILLLCFCCHYRDAIPQRKTHPALARQRHEGVRKAL